jgi:hypothetical protein
MSKTFTFVYSDAAGATSLAGGGALINSSDTGVNACWFYYDRASNQISLANNSTSSWNSAPLAGARLSNSQCTISQPSVSINGNNMSLTVSLSFTTGFRGTRNIYMYAQDNGGLNTGYPQMGTWNVSKK